MAIAPSSSASPMLQVPVASFRRIVSPHDNSDRRTYLAVVNVFDIPDLSSWRRINVRDARETGRVPREIRQSLENSPDMFFYRNRGLLLSVASAALNTETNRVDLQLSDPDRHGLGDGGHTYTVIRSYCDGKDRSALQPTQQAHVRVEILEGFTTEELRDIVEARNTSNQVRDQSLAELAHEFDKLKLSLAGQPYAELVAYKEYEIYEGADGPRPKPIDVRDIVALLSVFDRDHYGEASHPVFAYSQKATALKHFRTYPASYEKILPLAKDILCLWDTIHLHLPEWYKTAKAAQGQGAKFGRITGIDRGNVQLYFLSQAVTGDTAIIPDALKYPILAALRALLEEDAGRWIWGKGIDPFEALESGLGPQLADVVLSNYLEMRSPNRLGKASAVWDQCYNKAQIWYLKRT
ncbi:MAG: AIPR family protein [Chloroflexi bacterium]|nr:AIPR family protein [Chloroflexota bacterium]